MDRVFITNNEVEGIVDASVIIGHLSVGITAETVLKPIVTNCLNLVHTGVEGTAPCVEEVIT